MRGLFVIFIFVITIIAFVVVFDIMGVAIKEHLTEAIAMLSPVSISFFSLIHRIDKTNSSVEKSIMDFEDDTKNPAISSFLQFQDENTFSSWYVMDDVKREVRLLQGEPSSDIEQSDVADLRIIRLKNPSKFYNVKVIVKICKSNYIEKVRGSTKEVSIQPEKSLYLYIDKQLHVKIYIKSDYKYDIGKRVVIKND